MKKSKIIGLLPILSLALFLTSCPTSDPVKTTTSPVETTSTPGVDPSTTTATEITEEYDYVADLTLNLSSPTKKAEVDVKQFIDGDTTHFNISDPDFADGVLKARYIAINTPESTGKIEPWGKKASKFTKEKLSQATSIYVESDDASWNADSTGSRYVVWVWYKTEDSTEYRNLNLEILQNGLALASNTGGNRYGTICLKALAQAEALKLNLYSDDPDPDFYYGSVQQVTLAELKLNLKKYENTKVAFTANVIKDYNNGVYLEEYSPELGMYVGMYAYYGASAPGYGLEIVKPGNRIMCVGTPQYYEAGDSWQVSGLAFANPFIPASDDVTTLISEGHNPVYRATTLDELAQKVTFVIEKEVEGQITEETLESTYLDLSVGASISMENLKVKRIYTTASGNSTGAMTITCDYNGKEVTVRTAVLYNDDNTIVTQDKYENKTISVKGIVETYKGKFQILVLSPSDITILN